jgi:hypothetical protein
MKSDIKIQGFVRLEVRDKDGNLLHDTGRLENLITNAGKAAVAGLVGNTGAITAFSYLALGTSSTAAAATQTALVAEIVDSGLARAAATMSRTTTTVTNDTLRFVYTWTASGTKSVQEVGAFNASSAGTMLGRKVVTQLDLINTNTCTLTYDFVFS